MRMNLEQASKVQLETPTRLRNGEGRSTPGKQRTGHLAWSPGVVRTACTEGPLCNVGGPVSVRGRDPQRHAWWRPVRASERPTVPLRPGNAGGGKGPYFGSAFNGVVEGRLA